jgi:hypothetical protein
MDVIAVLTAIGEKMIANAEQTAPVEEPKSKKKARVGARSAHVAKGNSGKKATSAKKAPKSRKRAVAPPARKGSKTAQVLDLIQRAGGATLQELMAATEWQPHSIRGFISGTLGKKLGLAVESSKSDKGERTYSLKG